MHFDDYEFVHQTLKSASRFNQSHYQQAASAPQLQQFKAKFPHPPTAPGTRGASRSPPTRRSVSRMPPAPPPHPRLTPHTHFFCPRPGSSEAGTPSRAPPRGSPSEARSRPPRPPQGSKPELAVGLRALPPHGVPHAAANAVVAVFPPLSLPQQCNSPSRSCQMPPPARLLAPSVEQLRCSHRRFLPLSPPLCLSPMPSR